MNLGRDIIDYFLSPKETGYDIPKTFSYSIVLVLASYIVFKILKKLDIRIDEKLAISITPYVAFGAMLRVIQDIGVFNSYFFVTPGIYLFVFSITFSSIALSLILKKRFGLDYFKTTFIIGTLLLPFMMVHLKIENVKGLLMVLIFFLPWLIASRIVNWDIKNKIIVLLHMFDATTTFVSLKFFGYYEQHIVPTILINLFGPLSFIPIKLLVITSVLVIIDNLEGSEEDIEFKNYIKLIIGILGAATGTRDVISLLAGV